MIANFVEQDSISNQRLSSLDFFRGAIMVLLMLEGARFYDHLSEIWPDNFLLGQFFHHPWNGLYFWDLIQPAFMFIAGTSMAYSVVRQQQAGVTWQQSFSKMLKRCGWLFFWGVLNYAVRGDHLSFELWNVLTQLSFTLLVAFLIFDWSITKQLVLSLVLLLVTELLYRYAHIPGFDQPFTNKHNFGSFMDLILMGQMNSDGWVAINCLPTAAHTIWGAVVGKLLMSSRANDTKIKYLLGFGLLSLLAGYALGWLGIPIIKRISTSSFVLASGGWSLLLLAFFFWWIDIRKHARYITFFSVVGINSIFIYLFFEIVGARWFNEYVFTIVTGITGWLPWPHAWLLVVGSCVVFGLEWWLCWFLYQKKIFFKL